MKQRKCQGCKQIKNADLMHKITEEFKSGKLYLNPCPKILGRSAYVCKNRECINILIKKKALKKALKTSSAEQIEQELLAVAVEGQ